MFGVIRAWLLTILMLFIWTLLLPIAPFIPHSNCWYFAMKKRILRGGKVHLIRSKRWSGHHWFWQDKNGLFWEYTMTRMPKFTPFWKLIMYRGVERRFRGKHSAKNMANMGEKSR